MKGSGSRLCSAMYAWIADITASTLRKTPRRIANHSAPFEFAGHDAHAIGLLHPF
jgi:hypothetical protein